MALTVLIPCRNEAENLRELLPQVAWADEVLVVDSYSDDDTVETARAHGARVLQHVYENSTAQKNWAIPQARHPWILVVDADERVSPELADEVRRTVAADPPQVAFWIRRRNTFFGRPVRWGAWRRDRVIRLFRRDRCRYRPVHVHGEIEADGPVGTLRSALEHHSWRDLPSVFRRLERYAWWAALDRLPGAPPVRWRHLALRPAARFLRDYVLWLGFLDGFAGLAIAGLDAGYVFRRTLCLWRLQQGDRPPPLASPGPGGGAR